MARTCFTLVSFAVGLFAGCAIERGQSPYRNRRDEPVFSRMEDYNQPGGLIAITPAVENRVACPHCGAVNMLGQTNCTACGKRLSLRPVWTPCKTCEGRGKDPKGEACKFCDGRGWVTSPEEE